jgi:hypothetical protein
VGNSLLVGTGDAAMGFRRSLQRRRLVVSYCSRVARGRRRSELVAVVGGKTAEGLRVRPMRCVSGEAVEE